MEYTAKFKRGCSFSCAGPAYQHYVRQFRGIRVGFVDVAAPEPEDRERFLRVILPVLAAFGEPLYFFVNVLVRAGVSAGFLADPQKLGYKFFDGTAPARTAVKFLQRVKIAVLKAHTARVRQSFVKLFVYGVRALPAEKFIAEFGQLPHRERIGLAVRVKNVVDFVGGFLYSVSNHSITEHPHPLEQVQHFIPLNAENGKAPVRPVHRTALVVLGAEKLVHPRTLEEVKHRVVIIYGSAVGVHEDYDVSGVTPLVQNVVNVLQAAAVPQEGSEIKHKSCPNTAVRHSCRYFAVKQGRIKISLLMRNTNILLVRRSRGILCGSCADNFPLLSESAPACSRLYALNRCTR